MGERPREGAVAAPIEELGRRERRGDTEGAIERGGATRALMWRRAEGATSGGGAMAPRRGMEAAAAGVRVWGR